MKKQILIILATAYFLADLSAQQGISKILEYRPAPGQFINKSPGMPSNAQAIKGNTLKAMVSLGGYGGYIVVGFDKSIENDPNNPYGIDFTVFGNPLKDWSEPGIIMVMKDENSNGKPDDTWYELAGSDYYRGNTIKRYQVTYTNPGGTTAEDVPWADNQGQKGSIKANEYHDQPYYPLAQNFPSYPQDNCTFSGTCIQGNVDLRDGGMVKSYTRAFGYADNYPKGPAPYDVPDNPYTNDVEGCGGDPMDISWAIDKNGTYVDLDKIDFIKIYNGINKNAGWLGEVSTEIRGVIDVSPNASLTGQKKKLVIYDMPLQVSAGEEVQLEWKTFLKGRPMNNQEVGFSVQNSEVGSITQAGIFVGKAAGKASVYAWLKNDPSVWATSSIDIISPDRMEIMLAKSYTIRAGDKIELHARIKDKNNEELSNVIDVQWLTRNVELAEVKSKRGPKLLIGKKEGSTYLVAKAKGFPKLKDSVRLTILPEPIIKSIDISIVHGKQTIVPKQKLKVDNFDLSGLIEKANKDYSLKEIQKVTVAHAIGKAFTKQYPKAGIRFKDDQKSNGKLYLWKIPFWQKDNVSYFYGYGENSKTTSSSARSWVVQINGVPYLSNLHQIKLNEGDNIIVYHIENINEPWFVDQIMLEKDTLDPGEEIKIALERTRFALTADKKISKEKIVELAGIEIKVIKKGSVHSTIKTDLNGQASLILPESGDYQLIAVNSSLPIHITGETTPVESIAEKEEVKAWPIPCHNHLNISLGTLGKDPQLTLINQIGQTQQINYQIKRNMIIVNTSSLQEGTYLLKIKTEQLHKVIRFLKL